MSNDLYRILVLWIEYRNQKSPNFVGFMDYLVKANDEGQL